MEKYLYIKQSIAKQFVDFGEPLSAEEYNNLGETWQDYVDNKWVLLNEEQRAFYIEHPNAVPKEVWDMEMFPKPERTIEQAKQEKIEEIEIYDKSPNVNLFYVYEQPMWLDFDERSRILTSISAYRRMGRTEMTKIYGDTEFTLPLDTWEELLAAVEIYASECLNVTERHKREAHNATNDEELAAIDITAGYPEKLVFRPYGEPDANSEEGGE